MRLERLTLRGFSSAFPGTVDLPLRDLPTGVIAITGPNGAGKTTLLEATPGALYRQLPARNGEDPVTYALGRDSFIELEYAIDGRGAFRSRLNLDGPKRQTDAVLEAILADGTRARLNDGKRSTYDEQIRQRFPSFDLFINSTFAAQGRGDEFTRAKPSQKKDLFTEFLALQPLLAMAKAAGQAAELVADACLRLTVRQETLARETDQRFTDELDRLANDLQATGGQAELRKAELSTLIADLEARAAVCQDQVAAYVTAQARVRTLETDLAGRQAERDGVTRQREAADTDLAAERTRLTQKRDADIREAANKIAGNEKIQGMAADICAAVAAIERIDGQVIAKSGELSRQHAAQVRLEADRRALERALAALAPIEQQLARSRTDAGLLETVPCEGAGQYAACQFLKNATEAQARIADLEARVLPKAEHADRVGALTRDIDAAAAAVTALEDAIRGLEAEKATHVKLQAYVGPLAAAEARIAELTAQQAAAESTAAEAAAAAHTRHDRRVSELDLQATHLDAMLARLTGDLSIARTDLAAAASGNSQAVQLQAELVAGRREWDAVTATLARVQSGHEDLARRRQGLADKRTALTDMTGRLARIQQELVEWRDLAKALGKGGLPDLEIDAAGPTISALTNDLLLSCFGARFTLELVTQTAKTDGGLKDEFTARVMDNDTYGGWRDISQLSGGEKVIVQEALMAAIAIYVNERSPMPMRTLFRDETGAALDVETAPRYMQMLRRVRERGGFHHVFLITHNLAAAALADAQIHVGGGQASIALPPFTAAEAA